MTPGMVANSECRTGHTQTLTMYEQLQAECSYRPALTVGHSSGGRFLSCQLGNKPCWIGSLVSFNFTELTRFLYVGIKHKMFH